MAVLTAQARAKLKPSQFALPGGRYPIYNESHARNALARVSQFGTDAEKATVRAAVHRKYPGIKMQQQHKAKMAADMNRMMRGG